MLGLVLALVAAAGLSWQFSRPDSRLYLLDHPNARSLHTLPTPRSGGVAVLTALVLSGVVTLTYSATLQPLLWMLAALFPLAWVSWQDDRGHVNSLWRLLVHLGAGGLLCAAELKLTQLSFPGGTWALGIGLSWGLSLLFYAWMINLYNFMDGMDGFAGGMAVCGFATLAYLGQADEWFSQVCLLITGAAGGFLLCNFPPARIFLGDVGSAPLGLLAAVMLVWAEQRGVFPLWLGVLVFSPFIVDASVTLARRLWRGERVWQAHREHSYQRLVQCGWGHTRTVLCEYVLMLTCAVLAVLLQQQSPLWQWLGLLLSVVLYSGLLWTVERYTGSRRQRESVVRSPT